VAGRKGKTGAGHTVIVYTAPWCPWCRRVKEFLSANNVKFEERDIEAKNEWAEEAVAKSGQTGIPILDIDGHVVIGFDEPAIRELLGL
jgi:glutaredoxin 3